MTIAKDSMTWKEMLKNLRAPIPREFIARKQVGGGKSADYIGITTCKDLLDSRIGADKWEAAVSRMALNETGLVMIVRITFHSSDGIYSSEGTGFEAIFQKEVKRKINNEYVVIGTESTVFGGRGDLASNAYAQAFRRALEGIGFAREIWRQELSDEQLDIKQEQVKEKALETERTAKKVGRTASQEQIDTLFRLLGKFNAKTSSFRTEQDVAVYYSNGEANIFAGFTGQQAKDAINGVARSISTLKGK